MILSMSLCSNNNEKNSFQVDYTLTVRFNLNTSPFDTSSLSSGCGFDADLQVNKNQNIVPIFGSKSPRKLLH